MKAALEYVEQCVSGAHAKGSIAQKCKNYEPCMPVRNVIGHLSYDLVPYTMGVSVTTVRWLWHNIKTNTCSENSSMQTKNVAKQDEGDLSHDE